MITIELFRIFGSILLNDDQARRGLSDINREASNSEGRLGAVGRAGSAMGSMIVKYAGMATAALATMGGVVEGIKYDAQLEQSTAAWKTLLGTQKDATDMMKNIANLAKNTQFDTTTVDDMAKYLHNAGIESKDLNTEIMKSADVAGAFNISADAAKEMVRQMSQVRQAGVAYTEDINILADRGVPIYQALSKQMHTTVANVKNLASQGKISSDVYIKAFDGIANGVKGASEAQSKTFNGMLSTLKDSISQISGALAKPLFNSLEKGLQNVMPLVDSFTSLAQGDFKGFEDTVTHAFGPGMGGAIVNLTKNVQKGKQAIEGIFDIFKGGAAEGKGISILNNLGFSSDTISKIQSVVATIKGIVTQFFHDYVSVAKSELSNIIGFFTGAWDAIKKLFSGNNSLSDSFTSIFNTIKQIALPILQDIVKFVQDKFAQIKIFWDENGDQIIQAVKNFWAVIAAIFQFLAPVLEFIIKSVWDNIKGIIDGALKIIMGLIKVFAGIFTGDWSKVWEGIKQILGGAIEAIWNAIQLLFIARVLKAVGGFFGLIKGLFSGGWSEIIGGIKSFVGGAEGWFQSFVQTAKTKFKDIVEAAKNIPSGIAKGLSSGIKTVEDAIVGIADSLIKKFKKALGINSPSKVFTEMGGHILDGLTNGLTSGNLLDLGKMVFSDFGGGIFNSFDKIKTYIKMFDSGMLSKIGGNIKDFFTSIFSGGGSGGTSGNVASWISAALGITGAPASWLGPLSTLVQKESGGNPNAINLWDSNAKAGHPSKGLFQTIDSTFNAYAIKGLGGIYNPIANAVAGIRYIMDRYGSVFNVPGIRSMAAGGGYRGYYTGTNYADGGMALVGEHGPELMYVPQGSKIKTTNETSNLLGSNINVNIQPAPVIIGDRQVAEIVFDHIDDMQTTKFSQTLVLNGVKV